MIFLVYCIASLFYYVFVFLVPLCDTSSYCYGAIQPVCAESAVKPQANKQTFDLYKNLLQQSPNVLPWTPHLIWSSLCKIGRLNENENHVS